MKQRIRAITSRSSGKGDAWRKDTCGYFIRGWVNYFKLADMKSLLEQIDTWYRRRLRMVIWKQWKRIKTKFRNLMKSGNIKSKAWEFANTRKGYSGIQPIHLLFLYRLLSQGTTVYRTVRTVV
jgi:hypothetical protein